MWITGDPPVGKRFLRRRGRGVWTGARAAALLALSCLPAAIAFAERPAHEYRADARAFEALVNERYAYLDHLGGSFALTPELEAEAEAVTDRRALLALLERAVALLADHHAITGASFSDSRALVPSYADILVDQSPDGGWRVTAIRPGSPATDRVQPGDRIAAVEGVAFRHAIARFWSDLGIAEPDARQRRYGALALLAGRRDRPRSMTLERGGRALALALPNLYAEPPLRDAGPVTVSRDERRWTISLNDSLGKAATIPAFDAAMAAIPAGAALTLDLTDTPGGGNSTVARAIMGWFTRAPMPYQAHVRPAEERASGIARRWVEYVLPRAGLHHAGPLKVRVGGWTGSMGEGLAIGLDAMGFAVCGTKMAGLKGAVEDIVLPASGLVVKLPVERLETVAGLPREDFIPRPLDDPACADL